MTDKPLRKDEERVAKARSRPVFVNIAASAPGLILVGIVLGVVTRLTYEGFLWGWDLFGF